MQGFDVNRFVRDHRPSWEELSFLVEVAESTPQALGVDGMRTLGQLYRKVSNDLIRARAEGLDATTIDYLNTLVARSYALVHAGRPRRAPWLVNFFLREYPRLVRAEGRAIAWSALLLALGVVVGATIAAADPSALAVVLPAGAHQQMLPDERIALDEGTALDGETALPFAAFLMSNNIKVGLMALVLGITFGVGTSVLLFANGVPLGALGMQYFLEGEGLFFWAWILPHGIPELTAIVIYGAGGFQLARGLLAPGDRTRSAALVEGAARGVKIALGTVPLLVLAGFIEGTLSQLHEPFISYEQKLAMAAFVGALVYAYLLGAGRERHARGRPRLSRSAGRAARAAR